MRKERYLTTRLKWFCTFYKRLGEVPLKQAPPLVIASHFKRRRAKWDKEVAPQVGICPPARRQVC